MAANLHEHILFLLESIKKKGKTIRLSTYSILLCKMKMIKKGQTDPVYSAFTHRAFERMKLLVQSTEPNSR